MQNQIGFVVKHSNPDDAAKEVYAITAADWSRWRANIDSLPSTYIATPSIPKNWLWFAWHPTRMPVMNLLTKALGRIGFQPPTTEVTASWLWFGSIPRFVDAFFVAGEVR